MQHFDVDEFPSYPKNGVYLDSMTVGLQHRNTIQALEKFNSTNGGVVRKGLSTQARIASEVYYASKKTYASYFNGDPDNFAWIPNSDYGWNIILHSLLANHPKPKIIASLYDHHSILAPIVHLDQLGLVNLQFLSIEDEYNLPDTIDHLTDESTILVLSHVSPIIGLYRDIESIYQRCLQKGVTMVVDYSRSIGQSDVSISKSSDIAIIDGSIDLLGPQGAGLLYFNENFKQHLLNPFPGTGSIRYVLPTGIGQLRSYERFETGNPNVGAMAALAESLRLLDKAGKYNIINHRIQLMKHLIESLDEISAISILDPLIDTKMGNPQRASALTITTESFSSHDIAMLLDEQDNIAIRSGRMCAHPGLFALELEEVNQISIHYYNTLDDIDLLVQGLKRILNL